MKTEIVIKLGSKWRTKAKDALVRTVRVLKVGKRYVTITHGNMKEPLAMIPRREFGRADGYLPLAIHTPATVRP